MASRYEIIDYMKQNYSSIADKLGDDKSIYEWARKKYALTNYPSWDEIESKVNIDESYTANFKQPKNQIQKSNLKNSKERSLH